MVHQAAVINFQLTTADTITGGITHMGEPVDTVITEYLPRLSGLFQWNPAAPETIRLLLFK